MSTRDRSDENAEDQRLGRGVDDGEMDKDDNRARGDGSLSEPGGSSFGHVLLSAAPRVCEATAVGTGVKFRHRIGGTAATDGRPPELREQDQMASGAVASAELDLRLSLSERAMTFFFFPCWRKKRRLAFAWLNYRWDGGRVHKSRFSSSE
jgi:hypothetical protein